MFHDERLAVMIFFCFVKKVYPGDVSVHCTLREYNTSIVFSKTVPLHETPVSTGSVKNVSCPSAVRFVVPDAVK